MEGLWEPDARIIVTTIMTKKGGISYACPLYLMRSIRNSQFVND